MAVAWLIVFNGLPQPNADTEKRRLVLFPYLEAVGKARIMGR